MGFFGKLNFAIGKNGTKNFGKAIKGVVTNANKSRKEMAPRAQYYGGSEEASKRFESQFQGGIQQGTSQAQAGIDRVNRAADAAGPGLSNAAAQANQIAARNAAQADAAGRGFGSQIGMYNDGRAAILGNASTLERQAASLPQTYMQTSQQAFAANQDANARNAMSLAARGGAAGLRAALAGSTTSNAQAAAQAEITRANEMNQLAQMQQNAITQAANIRSGVGAQDQGAGGLYQA